MRATLPEIVESLARSADAVCRRYLSRGRREGAYWLVGDVHNRPGRSLFVRLVDAPGAAAGKWKDAATGEHGDLLDLIGLATGALTIGARLREARLFLGDFGAQSPSPDIATGTAIDTIAIATRLWGEARPCAASPVARYLAARGLADPGGDVLRFHPRCVYRRTAADGPDAPRHLPAMIAAVRDEKGDLVGVHRTFLDPVRPAKADVAQPRRALGRLRGLGTRFGVPGESILVGEGIETVLAARMVLPHLCAIAALSAAHLGMLALPTSVRRLYLLVDDDRAGHSATARLARRACDAGLVATALEPLADDFATDLVELGPDALRSRLQACLDPRDRP